ncbi:hypothetical protein HaLaN_15357 [Haematococcus lacustris]|uniref:Uncharacterized protein n=1 Tax=Haematococcus lacustris TaxID=44745 RepID=A0A699ZI58_HAELA|nr:hypothetical protein HaLaN_15357 [Haematococcus lacustris]
MGSVGARSSQMCGSHMARLYTRPTCKRVGEHLVRGVPYARDALSNASVAHLHPLLAHSAWVRHGGAALPAAELAWAARPGCNAADVQRG